MVSVDRVDSVGIVIWMDLDGSVRPWTVSGLLRESQEPDDDSELVSDLRYYVQRYFPRATYVRHEVITRDRVRQDRLREACDL